MPTNHFNVWLDTRREWHKLWQRQSLQHRLMSGHVLDWQHPVCEWDAQSKQCMPELPTGNRHHQLDLYFEWFELCQRQGLQLGFMSGRLWHRWDILQCWYGESGQPLQELPAGAVNDGLVGSADESMRYRCGGWR